MCISNVTVHYQSEGSSLMNYTLSNTTATSATLSNLQCNTEYTIWVVARGGQTATTSVPIMVSQGMYTLHTSSYSWLYFVPLHHPAPPTPAGVTPQFASASSVTVTWQWTSSGPAPDCFNTTTVTYRPEGGGESSLQLRDSTANRATLIDLRCNTNYTITVVATAGGHRREGTVFLLLPGIGIV